MRFALALSLVACFVATSCAPAPQQKKELCDNGIDDDVNGLTDCADPACAAEQFCQAADAGFFGFCAKCGHPCVKPQDCLSNGWRDTPLPMCLETICQAMFADIDVRLELDTSAWAAASPAPASWQTRLVSKTALDGSQVSCATLRALATATDGAHADQIEASNRFNFLAYDVTKIGTFGMSLTQPFFHVDTGSNFIIWTELWGGGLDPDTKLPTGMRRGVGCFEDGPAVADIKVQDDWPVAGPTSTSRTIKIVMPLP